MIVLALRTGMRQGEILGLLWEDVDLQRGQIVVRRARWRGHMVAPKNGRTREIPLSPKAHRAMKKHRHLRGDFVHRGGGAGSVLRRIDALTIGATDHVALGVLDPGRGAFSNPGVYGRPLRRPRGGAR